MLDLRDLYQQTILDHNRRPRNYREIDDADRVASGDNPLCGDKVTVYLKIEDDIITDVSFSGSGCAISQASASLMTTSVMGKSSAEAKQLLVQFQTMVTGEVQGDGEGLGKLAAFSGVREFPARVKCANLAWHTLRAALEAETEPITTE
jgi:nitrogen fixation NifU-like protein